MDEEASTSWAVELESGNADTATANKLKTQSNSKVHKTGQKVFMHCVVNINEEKVLLRQTAPESYHWSYLNRFPVALHSCTEPLQVTSTPAVTVHIPRVAEFEVYGDASRVPKIQNSNRSNIQYTSYIFVPSPPQNPCTVKKTKTWKHRTSLHRSFTLHFAVCIHQEILRFIVHKSYRIPSTPQSYLTLLLLRSLVRPRVQRWPVAFYRENSDNNASIV